MQWGKRCPTKGVSPEGSEMIPQDVSSSRILNLIQSLTCNGMSTDHQKKSTLFPLEGSNQTVYRPSVELHYCYLPCYSRCPEVSLHRHVLDRLFITTVTRVDSNLLHDYFSLNPPLCTTSHHLSRDNRKQRLCILKECKITNLYP